MGCNIFSQQGKLFLENKMCICMDDLTHKILTDAPNEVEFFKNMIDEYLTIKFYRSDDLSQSQIEKNKKMFELTLEYDKNIDKLEKYPKAKSIYDELYYILRSYSSEGLSGVWYHKEASLWYPKVIITRNFGSRDVIDSLDDIVSIYRGTSEDEYNSNKFGQAWSLKKHIAHNFAFIHYKESTNYKNTVRVVIQAQINKNDIFHYRKGHSEEEVVINSAKLIHNKASLIEKMTLE